VRPRRTARADADRHRDDGRRTDRVVQQNVAERRLAAQDEVDRDRSTAERKVGPGYETPHGICIGGAAALGRVIRVRCFGMGKVFDEIDAKLADWIGRQRLFFVGTAPREGGRVNVSPKGPIETLRVVGPHAIEYDDHVGSGAETIAHLRDNGRICVMLCALTARRASSGSRAEGASSRTRIPGARAYAASSASRSTGSPTRAATAFR
jgi:hypothetical protein